jgi:hypothetical protein
VLAVLVLLACVIAVGCGGQEAKTHRGPTAKTPRPDRLAEGSGRLVAIGDGRTLYMECVGSGSPTVLLEAGYRRQDELAALSENSVHVVALASNHDVPIGQPSVIVRAVQAVVGAARSHTRLPRCRRLFSGSDVRCRG